MILDTEKVENRWMWLLSCHRSWVPESIKRVKKKVTSLQSLTYQWMAPFIVSICFAASSHNTTRWISLAFSWLICFRLLPHSLSIPFIFCCSFFLRRVRMMVPAKEVVISPYSTLHKTLVYSGEWGVWWKPASSEKIGCRQSPHFPPSSW